MLGDSFSHLRLWEFGTLINFLEWGPYKVSRVETRMFRLLKNWLDTALGEPGGIPEVEEDVLWARGLASHQVFTISYKVLRREFIAIGPAGLWALSWRAKSLRLLKARLGWFLGFCRQRWVSCLLDLLFSHSKCHHGGAKQIMILGNFRITTSISITIITISITLVISQSIAIKRIIISIIMAISIQHS